MPLFASESYNIYSFNEYIAHLANTRLLERSINAILWQANLTASVIAITYSTQGPDFKAFHTLTVIQHTLGADDA